MSHAGRNTSDLQTALYAGLVGQTISGMATIASFTITAADDEDDPAAGGSVACADGGVTVTLPGGSTTSNMHNPESSGSAVQWRWEHTVLTRLAVDVAGCRVPVLHADLYIILDQLINLVSATFQPTSGTNYNLVRMTYNQPRRHQTATSFYLFQVTSYIKEGWART